MPPAATPFIRPDEPGVSEANRAIGAEPRKKEGARGDGPPLGGAAEDNNPALNPEVDETPGPEALIKYYEPARMRKVAPGSRKISIF